MIYPTFALKPSDNLAYQASRAAAILHRLGMSHVATEIACAVNDHYNAEEPCEAFEAATPLDTNGDRRDAPVVSERGLRLALARSEAGRWELRKGCEG